MNTTVPRPHENVPDVIVIGAGHNGLVAACYLAKAGRDVLVLEASPTVGGMMSTNPIIAGAPGHLVNEGAIQASLFRASSIERDLGLGRYGFHQLQVDPPHVHLDRDGRSIAIHHDPRKTAEDIRRHSRRDAEAWLELSATLDSVMNMVIPYMLHYPMRPKLGPLLKGLAKSGRRPRELAEVARLFTISQAEAIDERFEHPLTRGILASMATFSAMSQDATGWALIYLGLFQTTGSSMFEGGTGALPNALHACLDAHGGRVRTSARVQELAMRGDTVTGVVLDDGEEITARAVISTCNPKTTFTKLLPGGVLQPRMTNRVQHIPTAITEAGHLKLDIALKGRVRMPNHDRFRSDGLDLRRPLATWHTLEDHVEAWNAVVARRTPDVIPIMGTIPTATDPTQAPAGQDVVWLWSGEIPYRPHVPWELQRDAVEKQILDDVSGYYEGIDELQIARSFRTPEDVEKRFNALDGNVYHVDALATRFGPLRPAWGLSGYRTPIPGLFISGAGTHPSGGICGVPGKLAAGVVLKDLADRGGSALRRRRGAHKHLVGV
jgi:phytoene dehydrogenase-like protein